MALATNLLQGQASEWALLKRHPCEDVFGVQVCGGYPDALSRTAQLIEDNCDVSFVDVNMGCPIDLICDRCAVLCCAVLCCAVLCCAVLCCAVLWPFLWLCATGSCLLLPLPKLLPLKSVVVYQHLRCYQSKVVAVVTHLMSQHACSFAASCPRPISSLA